MPLKSLPFETYFKVNPLLEVDLLCKIELLTTKFVDLKKKIKGERILVNKFREEKELFKVMFEDWKKEKEGFNKIKSDFLDKIYVLEKNFKKVKGDILDERKELYKKIKCFCRTVMCGYSSTCQCIICLSCICIVALSLFS